MNTEILTKSFNNQEIRHRKGPYGKDIAYLSGVSVIRRLNLAFKHSWTFTINKSWVSENEIFVESTIEAEGIKKSNIGSASVDKPDSYKAAVTDSLKRCGVLWGIGLELYEPQRKNAGQISTNSNPPSERQVGALKSICTFKSLNPNKFSIDNIGKELKDANKQDYSTLIDLSKAV